MSGTNTQSKRHSEYNDTAIFKVYLKSLLTFLQMTTRTFIYVLWDIYTTDNRSLKLTAVSVVGKKKNLNSRDNQRRNCRQ